MANMFKYVALAVMIAACGPHGRGTASHPTTIHIEQTPIKNQYRVGFCWAYTISGMLESLEAEKGQQIDLSEEHLGFYNLLAQMREIVASKQPLRKLASLNEGNTMRGMADLPATAGMVPESVWGIKFQESGLEEKIIEHFATTLKDPANIAAYRTDANRLFDELADLFGKRPLKPDESFTFEGKTWTPVSFVRDRLKYNPADYADIRITEENFDLAIHYMKMALMKKISVPFATMMLQGINPNGVWQGEDCADDGCMAQGGHGMLAVDFITTGGRGGDMPLAEAKAIFHKPLEFVILKNSWGQQGTDQNGNASAQADKTGYDMMSRTYLEQALLHFPVSVLVPKSVMTGNDRYLHAGLKAGIEAPLAIGSEQELPLTAHVLDVPAGASGTPTFRWTFRSIDRDGSAGDLPISADGVSTSILFTRPGAYEIVLSTKLGTLTDTVTKRMWVFEKKTANVFDMKATFGATNQARVESTSNGHFAAVGDFREAQPAKDNNLSVVDLPTVALEPNGRLRVDYSVNLHDQVPFEIQTSFNGGTTWTAIWCKPLDEDSLANATAVPRECYWPGFGGQPSSSSSDIRLRVAFHQSPMDDQKIQGRSTVGNLAIAIAGGNIEEGAERIYVSATYPAGTTMKRFAASGESIPIDAVMTRNTDQVRVYLDDKLVNQIAQSSLTPQDNAVRVSTMVSAGEPGHHAVRLVGMDNGREAAALPFEIFTTTPTVINPGDVQQLDLAQDNTLVSAGWFARTEFGLSASRVSQWGDPVSLARNLNSTAVLALDMHGLKKLTLQVRYQALLEEATDAFAMSASTDGGKTFESLLLKTGSMGSPATQNIDLTRFAGKDRVLVRFDALTDSAGPSRALVVRGLAWRGE